MSRVLKISLISVASLLLILVLVIGGLFIFVDPNDYKNEIAGKVHEATGRQLTISGNISYSLYPWIGLSLGTTELSNAQGFGDSPFAHIDQVDVKVKVLPLLLHQRLEMQKIRLHGLQANLTIDKTGRNNWDDMTAAKTSPAKTPTTKPMPEEKPSKTVPPSPSMNVLGALAIDGLELKNAHLEWHDQPANQHIVIDKMSLQTGQLTLSSPVDITLSMDMEMNQPAVNSHVDFKGQVAVDLDAQHYEANNLDLKLTAEGAGLPISPLNTRLRANVKADLSQQRIDVDKLQLETLATLLTGQLNITGLDKSPALSGKITVNELLPREVAKQLGITLPTTRDQSVLKKVRADITFAATSTEASINKLTLSLDDTELNGTASVKNYTSPAIRFDLKVDGIDADRYLHPVSEKEATSRQSPSKIPTGSAEKTETIPLPLEPLRQLDLSGNITLGKLKILGAQMKDMRLGIHGKGGQLQLTPIQAALYNGHYDGNINLDVRTDTPNIALNENLTSVNVGPLLQDVLGKELVSGTANIAAQLTAAGTDMDRIKKSLNGKANFRFQDGKVNGVSIGQMIREAYAKLKKKPAPPKTENATDFAEMSGSIVITNGIVKNNDLSAKSPLLRIKGEGKVDLPREQINYLVNAAIVESNEGQAGKELEELKSLTIPVKVTGNLTDPKFSLDLVPVLQKRAKKVLDKKVSSEKKKVKKRIEKNLKKKLEEDLKKKLGIKF